MSLGGLLVIKVISAKGFLGNPSPYCLVNINDQNVQTSFWEVSYFQFKF